MLSCVQHEKCLITTGPDIFSQAVNVYDFFAISTLLHTKFLWKMIFCERKGFALKEANYLLL